MSKDEKKLGKELSAEQMDDVAGGYLYSLHYLWEDGKTEVIDDETGDVLGTYENEEKARKAAADLGQSTGKLAWWQLDNLRKNWQKKQKK